MPFWHFELISMDNISTKLDLLHLSEILDGDTEFIPLLSPEDEEQMITEEVPEELPILPLRNTVLFPGVVIPITVGRDKSIKLIKEAYADTKVIGVVSQIEGEIENPQIEDLNTIGTVARLVKILQMPDGSTTVIIQGKKRMRVKEFIQTDPYFKARVESFEPPYEIIRKPEFEALISSVKEMAIQIIKKSPNVPSDAAFAIKNIESPIFTVNFVSSNLNCSVADKQALLANSDLVDRAQKVLELLTSELQVQELKNQIQSKVKTDLDKQQRDYLLGQQLKTIQEELGGLPHEEDIKDLRAKAAKNKWSSEVEETFDKELNKLQRMNPSAVEYSIQLNYLEVLVELPWEKYSNDNFDLENAQKILDEDHYGLEKVKERIIEYLAVLKLKGDMKSPILCLVGPPGVGKTSLGKSIARAVGRKYIRMSLGGVRDEAEIRGHRKTYIGAMPGRIIQNIRKAKSSNPVFVLDEIDKISGTSVNGDPSSALLEVLDPEQNIAFHDNFLEVDYDLSRTMFIATANTLNTLHPALRDRMEIIDVSGYLREEKMEIARRHLLPKQYREHGIAKGQLSVPKNVIAKVIENYTRESGVRLLDKTIAKILRYQAKFIAMDANYKKRLKEADLKEILGPPIFQKTNSINNEVAGVVTGLAWTAVGGEILFIEVSLSQGKGNLTLTGNLGDVMKESATIAYQYLKAHSYLLDINPEVFMNWDVHIHVPEGATPKDGPSAGVTMFTALASAFTQRKVKLKLAMTGEITLRGAVMPVGGIKEKILAAKRSKITELILPAANRKDIEEIKPEYIEGLNFHFAEEMTDVINVALLEKKVKFPLDLTRTSKS